MKLRASLILNNGQRGLVTFWWLNHPMTVCAGLMRMGGGGFRVIWLIVCPYTSVLSLKTTDTDFEQIMKGNPGQIPYFIS